MFFAVIFISIFGVTFSAGCPNGSIEWNSNCFLFQQNESAFVNAEEACVALGGHLTSIHNGFENAFIAQQASLFFPDGATSDIWIGASDLIDPGTFTWTDGSNFTFTEWGSPKNITGQDCGALNLSNGMWIADNCFKAKSFVCNIPNMASFSTPPPLQNVTQSPVGPPFYSCSLGWIYFEPTHSCYGGKFTATWSDAEESCKEQGAHLISIHNRDEQDFVATLVGLVNDWFWIGLYSVDSEHTWVYSDGTTYNYSNWKSGYPNAGNHECVNINPDGTWVNDASCYRKGYAFCRKDVLSR